jgi:uncharacterized protein DUF3515
VVLFFVADRNNNAHPKTEPTSAPTAAMSALPPVQVKPAPRTKAADQACPQLLAKLPLKLDGQGRRRTSTPNQYYLAWGNPTIIVHCGVPRPEKFVVGQTTTGIAPPGGKEVQWYSEAVDAGSTWTAVDRSVYVSVFIPDGVAATDVLQEIGKPLAQVLPARPIHPGPLIHPPR